LSKISDVKPIEPPDTFLLSAACGWVELGNWKEALAELEQISPAARAHPQVSLVRYAVCASAGQWDSAAEIAAILLERFPTDPQMWINAAYATRRKQGGGIEQAKDILLLAQQRFPKEPIIAYNLACYECQLNAMDAARQWLTKAMENGQSAAIRKMALNDDDLKALWPLIKEMRLPQPPHSAE
jgi:tetratricopeptide (TPR) repeat protein